MDLTKILFNVLQTLPKVIIELIIIPYMNSYKYSISEPFKNMYFNTQLGIVFCASKRSCELLDYDTMKPHKSSLINMVLFESDSYWKLPYSYTDVIYFDNDIIVIHSDYGFVARYRLCNHRFVIEQRYQVGHNYHNPCINNQRIYNLHHWDNKYSIGTTYIDDLSITKDSQLFAYANKESIEQYYTSIHKNTMYILEQHTSTLYNIYSHDAITLDRINNYIFRLESECKAITTHKDKIYIYDQNEVCIYDISTLNKIQSLHINSFKKYDNTYRMAISNELLMLSNSREMMIYDL
jgi:hypothetical protein